jgi:uncharacterized protein YdaU (DUF1376 family)
MHYYQHHIGDFIKATSRLTDSQVMAYLRILWMYYDKNGHVEHDIEQIAFEIGSDTSTVSLILKTYFEVVDGFLKQSRCDKEMEGYANKSSGGKKGAKARWSNAGKNKQSNSLPIAKLCEPNATPMLTKNQEPITSSGATTEKVKKRKTAMTLHKDTMPENYEEFIKVERPDLDPLQTYYKFCDYWLGNGEVKADWLATWRNWVRNEKKQFKPKSDVSNFEEMMRSAK